MFHVIVSAQGGTEGFRPRASGTMLGEMPLPRLVIVSNRVGVPEGSARAGGLEVAIRPALKRRGGVWFGWSGTHQPTKTPGRP